MARTYRASLRTAAHVARSAIGVRYSIERRALVADRHHDGSISCPRQRLHHVGGACLRIDIPIERFVSCVPCWLGGDGVAHPPGPAAGWPPPPLPFRRR